MKLSNLFSDTWEETFKSKFINWFIGSFVAIMGIGIVILLQLTTPLKWAILIPFLVNILLLFLFLIFNCIKAVVRHLKIERKNTYGEIILVLKDFFSKINFLRKLAKIDSIYLKPSLQEICDSLKECFDDKTNSKCCVSIKLFEKITDDGIIDTNATVYNLCRDGASQPERDSDIYKNINHTIFDNTPFLNIVRNILKQGSSVEECYYINNDIPKTDNYSNSSKAAYPKNKLPYNSELVVPLLPLNSEDGTITNLVGFICLDSNKKNSFGTKYDLPMLQGIADGIHDVIMKWKFTKN